ncbi:MAG: hypothetical protein ACRDRK_28005 [Pseudonocardia sp.]
MTLCAFLVIGVLLASAAHADDDVSSDDGGSVLSDGGSVLSDGGSAVSAVTNIGADAADAVSSTLSSDSGEVGESADQWTSDLGEHQRGNDDDETDASGTDDDGIGIGIGPAGSTIERAGALMDQVAASAASTTDSPVIATVVTIIDDASDEHLAPTAHRLAVIPREAPRPPASAPPTISAEPSGELTRDTATPSTPARIALVGAGRPSAEPTTSTPPGTAARIGVAPGAISGAVLDPADTPTQMPSTPVPAMPISTSGSGLGFAGQSGSGVVMGLLPAIALLMLPLLLGRVRSEHAGKPAWMFLSPSERPG